MVDYMNYNLLTWTTGERLWLIRRSLGLTQKAMGKRLGVCERTYWAAERDLGPTGKLVRAVGPKSLDKAPNPSLGALCALARRRWRRSLAETADLFDISHVTLLLWEHESEPRLRTAWEGFGYRFGK